MIKLLSNYWIQIIYWFFWQQLQGTTPTGWSIYDLHDWQIKGQWQTYKGWQWQMTEWDRVLTADTDKNTLTWITSIDVLDCRFHLKQKPLGDWLEESRWCNLLTDVETASTGKAESFLNASHVTRTRYAHQVTPATLHILMTKAHEKHSIEKRPSATSQGGEKIKSHSILSFIFGPKHLSYSSWWCLLSVPFVQAISISTKQQSVSLCHGFLHLTILTMLVGCHVICFNYKKPIQRFSVISMKVIL